MKCLVTRPEHDDTVHYLSKWIEPCIKNAASKGVKIFDLNRERANRKEVHSICGKEDPSLVLLNGHGNEDEIFGHRDEVIFKSGMNESSLNGKIVYALTCASAKGFGPSAIDKGALAFIGYEDDFIFEHTDENLTNPLKDNIAKPYLEPSCELVNALLKGQTAEEAYNKSQESYRAIIKRLLTSEGADPQMIRYLWWDMTRQKRLGKKDAAFK